MRTATKFAQKVPLHSIFSICIDSKLLHTMFLIDKIYDTPCSLHGLVPKSSLVSKYASNAMNLNEPLRAIIVPLFSFLVKFVTLQNMGLYKADMKTGKGLG